MSTLILQENMTTGDCPAQTDINAPDRAVMLMLKDQLSDDDNVAG